MEPIKKEEEEEKEEKEEEITMLSRTASTARNSCILRQAGRQAGNLKWDNERGGV